MVAMLLKKSGFNYYNGVGGGRVAVTLRQQTKAVAIKLRIVYMWFSISHF